MSEYEVKCRELSNMLEMTLVVEQNSYLSHIDTVILIIIYKLYNDIQNLCSCIAFL